MKEMRRDLHLSHTCPTTHRHTYKMKEGRGRREIAVWNNGKTEGREAGRKTRALPIHGGSWSHAKTDAWKKSMHRDAVFFFFKAGCNTIPPPRQCTPLPLSLTCSLPLSLFLIKRLHTI